MSDDAGIGDMGARPAPRQRVPGPITRNGRPEGREAVRAALLDATIGLIIVKGLTMTVREVAARAGVNHGLVHLYFGGKQQLLDAAYSEIDARAMRELDADGLPPADVAARRDGEIAKALARVILETTSDPSEAHLVLRSWRAGLVATGRAGDEREANEMVAAAAAMSLGWPLFRAHIFASLGIPEDGRPAIERAVERQMERIGGLNSADASDASASRPAGG
ncbi:MAG: TetR family transcriptional regulator [Ilumatobacteraceae bacterium]